MSLCRSLSFSPSAQAGQWALKKIKEISCDSVYPGWRDGGAQNTAEDTGFLPHQVSFRLSFIQRQPRLTGDVRVSPVIRLWLQKLHYTLEPHHQCAWTWIQLIALVHSSSRHLLDSLGFAHPYSLRTRSGNEPWHPQVACFSELTNVLSLEHPQMMPMALLLD